MGCALSLRSVLRALAARLPAFQAIIIPVCFAIYFQASNQNSPSAYVAPVATLVGVITFTLVHLVLASDAPKRERREPMALLIFWMLSSTGVLSLLASRLWQLVQEEPQNRLMGAGRVAVPLLTTLVHATGTGYVFDRRRSFWPALRVVYALDGCVLASAGILLRTTTHTEHYPPGTTTFGGCMLSSMCFILTAVYMSPAHRVQALRFLNTFSLGEIPAASLINKRHEFDSQGVSPRDYQSSVGDWSSASPSQSSVNDSAYLEKHAHLLDRPIVGSPAAFWRGHDERKQSAEM